jgi:hypothetical protein
VILPFEKNLQSQTLTFYIVLEVFGVGLHSVLLIFEAFNFDPNTCLEDGSCVSWPKGSVEEMNE